MIKNKLNNIKLTLVKQNLINTIKTISNCHEPNYIYIIIISWRQVKCTRKLNQRQIYK